MAERSPLLAPLLAHKESKRARLAEMLEDRWTHRLIITLIAIDALIVLLDISYQLLEDKCASDGSREPTTSEPEFLEALRTVSLVITTLFLAEIPLNLVAFGLRFYYGARRWGLHLMDALVVIVTFALEMILKGREGEIAGLLILARLWRLIKLVEGAALGMGEWDDQAALRASTFKEIARSLHLDPEKTPPELVLRRCQDLQRGSRA